MDPGLHLGVAEQEQCRAEAAGRAGAGRLVRVPVELLDEQTGRNFARMFRELLDQVKKWGSLNLKELNSSFQMMKMMTT